MTDDTATSTDVGVEPTGRWDVDTGRLPTGQVDSPGARPQRRTTRTSRPTELVRGLRPRRAAHLLNGRYELGEVLGRGGMGTVYRAVDHRLGRDVAIKMLHPGDRGAEGFRLRLQGEATIVAALRHRSVAHVHDCAEDRSSRDRTPFVIMELIEGVTLAQHVRRNGPLPVAQALAVVREVADALVHLESHGIVHRDLKPANIMLTTDGRLVLVDFGIAHAPTSQTLTTTGAVLGTVEYVSPEQVAGGAATSASDLYALGLIAFHCLTGESPFRRSSPIASAYAQIHDPLPDLPDGTPEGVVGLVRSLAAKAPTERPSGTTVLTRLAPWADGSELPHVTAADVLAARPAPLPVTAEATSPRRRRRSTAVLIAASFAAIAAVATGGVQQAEPADAADPTVADVEPLEEPDPAAVLTPETAVPNPGQSVEPAPPTPEPEPSVATTVVISPGPAPGRHAAENGNGNGNAHGAGNGSNNGNAQGHVKPS